MVKKLIPIIVFGVCTAVPLLATQQQESLGDLARQVRAQREKAGKKPVKTYTNDDLPARGPSSEGPAAASGMSQAPAEAGKASPAGAEARPSSPTEKPVAETESPADKVKTRDYWQAKFQSARRDLAVAKEAQRLSEDELNLLQIQQTRELDPNANAEVTAKVSDKQSEVTVNRATTEAAQKVLNDLEKEFKESGAPEEWSKTE